MKLYCSPYINYNNYILRKILNHNFKNISSMPRILTDPSYNPKYFVILNNILFGFKNLFKCKCFETLLEAQNYLDKYLIENNYILLNQNEYEKYQLLE